MVRVLNFTPRCGRLWGAWIDLRSGDGLGFRLGGGGQGGGEAGRGQLGGLFRGGIVRQALDDLGQIHLGIQVMHPAVGQQRVEQGVVGSGLQAAEEHPVAHSKLGSADQILHTVIVDIQNTLLEAHEELVPLVESIGDGAAQIALREMGLAMCEQELVELVGDGTAAAATDEFPAGGRCRGPAGLFLDEVDLLDEQQDREQHLGRSVLDLDEFAPDVGKAAGEQDAGESFHQRIIG